MAVGGHIETDEVPEHAAVREVKEEVGLDVVLWDRNKGNISDDRSREVHFELVPPVYMNVHRITDTHRHLSLVYFAKAESDVIIEPSNYEKSGECVWLTQEEPLARNDIDLATKHYALKALATLGETESVS